MKQGFTLIELLVVIAIIGILSSVVLSSLSTARLKSADARIQSQLQAMRAQADLYNGPLGNPYAASPCAFIGDTLFETTNNGLGNLFGGLVLANTRCASSGGLPSVGATWAVAGVTSSGAWCVDSRGVSRATAANNTAYTTDLETVILENTTSCS
jgi:prepilin-type N-terminal cleavage/methylation domain-containing protein